MSITIKTRLIIMALTGYFALGLSGGGAVAGGECEYSITDINFGDIDPATGGTTTGTFTASCKGDPGDTFRVCPNFDEGSGGSASGAPRYLLNGITQLQYNLYSDAGRTQIWGSHNWAFPYTPPTLDIPLLDSGQGSASLTIYAKVPPGQLNVGTGIYASTFAGADVHIAFRDKTDQTCADLGNSGSGGGASFAVQANITASCIVSATTLDFGGVGMLDTNIDATNALDITCTNGTPFAIGLNNGTSVSLVADLADSARRRMSAGDNFVKYGLYRDAARTQNWGSSIGIDTVPGTGTGAVQPFTVYGRVPVQTTPPFGTYTDTIVVTVTF